MLPPLRGVELESEFWFHPDRKWRFDFAIAPFKIAIEIDGRGRGKPDAIGRHQTVDGIRRDLEKHRGAVLRGWHIMRYPATDKANALAWAREVRELLGMIDPVLDQCAVCDCTELDCSQCVGRTGEPCYWARAGVCSACAGRMGKPRR
jgi:hypothetical protein